MIERQTGVIFKAGGRITTTRDRLVADLKRKYERGASIRALAEFHRAFIRIRPPCPQRGRCPTARAWWRYPHQKK
jgi:Helix-turn-helix domain